MKPITKMRDTYKPSEHFVSMDEGYRERIANSRERLTAGTYRRLGTVVGLIVSNYIKSSKCAYSLGHPIDSLHEHLESSISCAKEWEDVSLLERRYPDLLEWVGLCVLLDADQSVFEDLASILDRDPVKDRLVESLLSYKLNDRQLDVGNIVGDGQLQLLKALSLSATDKAEAQNQVRIYLEDHATLWLYGEGSTEKIPHTYDSGYYYGYWDYKSAAVSKLCGLDDSSYRDSKHYPVDLVDYKRQR